MSSRDENRHQTAFRIQPNHPAIPGHFPGNPVVPGVLLLDGVIESAQQWLGGSLRVLGLRQVKFIAPLLPDQEARIDLVLSDQSLDFSVQCGDAVLAKGSLTIELVAGP